jgi:hypothetical protein
LMEGVAVIVAVASASNSPEYDLLLEEVIWREQFDEWKGAVNRSFPESNFS